MVFGNQISGVLSISVYYLTHSLYQLDFFLKEYNGSPEFGAYQFYPFVLFLNKTNLTDINSIEEILYSLPKAGVYFTGFGGMIVDFGVIMSFGIFFVMGLVFSNCYLNFVKEGNMMCHYFSIIFFFIILLLPIVSVPGLAVFPSILLSTAFLWALRLIP